MGFSCTIGDVELAKGVKLFETQMRKTLEHAADVLKNAKGAAECTRWFGDSSGTYQQELGKKCYAMRAFVNLNLIAIRFSSLQELTAGPTTYAAAQRPSGGWSDYTALSKAHGVTFSMRVAAMYRGLPSYCGTVATNEKGSRFQTIAHELSHLCLNTEDEPSPDGKTAYGGTRARALATAGSARAKTNAENWGFFIEEYLVRI